MQDLLRRFIQEEDGDVVQNVIIVAIFAALALMFGNTIVDYVKKILGKLPQVETPDTSPITSKTA
jgi:hypothetical protein